MDKYSFNNLSTIRSLSNMIREMDRKQLEIKRITKTACLLIMSGVSPNSIPEEITKRVLYNQSSDGGWVSVVDTMWNIKYLQLINNLTYQMQIRNGLSFLEENRNENGLWGRSIRDFSRIPVSGIMFYLLPEMANSERCIKLEYLWKSELNSLVYKAGYTLLAFKRTNYFPQSIDLIESTCKWLVNNQRKDGGFAPWLTHPVDTNVYCTSIAVLGLLQYPEFVPPIILQKAYNWLTENRLHNGIWKYHEIEDGASWGIFALTQLKQVIT